MKSINQKECYNLLIKSKKIIITTHTNPDGDAIGSALGLYYFLANLGKSVFIINDSITPTNLEFLDVDNIIRFYSSNEDNSIIFNADLIVILDLNEPHRLKSMQDILANSNATKLLIDHHISPTDFTDFYYGTPEATSTGELVWKIMSDKIQLPNSKIANAIYTAIMTDTGSFRFPKTNQNTHKIIAKLIELGADPVYTYEQTYNQLSIAALKMLGEALSNIEIYFDGKVAIMTLTKEMFLRTGASNQDTDNFIDKTLSIKGVMMGILISYISDKNEIRVSVRSKDNYLSARELCLQFNGGGHLNAAGARIFDQNIDQAKTIIINEIQKLLNQYK